jgi:hypothetical protein
VLDCMYARRKGGGEELQFVRRSTKSLYKRRRISSFAAIVVTINSSLIFKQ